MAQTPISGVINHYAAVSVINFCGNTVTVNSAAGFSVGQRVMIIQMKGATIDGSNNASFGNINSYNGCGNYEINEISLISGTTIEFKYAMMRDYEAGGAIQLVSLEEYNDAIVSAPLTAQAWNGSTGGVLLLKANTLTLNDSITVKGKGFRGAVKENDNAGQACFNNGIGGATDYFCGTVNCGAPKGEGIGVVGGANYGRGKNGNGGGGGDDHNTGGGGGSNWGAGGVGGRRSNVGNNSCPGPAPGVGGAALSYTTAANKIFMGGGGGAGDGNNNEETSGGNGGGIVIIMAGTLTGNNKKINANGDRVDPTPLLNSTIARSDGAGGGGGGGTVLLFVDNFSGNVRVDAVGGDGGLLDNGGSTGTNAFCMGPGGGGGGGMLWVKANSVPGNIALVDTGGINGKDVYGLGPANCPYGTTNGAQSGVAGGSLTDLVIPTDTIPFVRLQATACCDTTVCPGSVITLSVEDTATFPPTIDWSSGGITHVITPQVFSSTSFIVTVTDWRGCQVMNTLIATVLNGIPNLILCCDTTVCPGATVSFNVGTQPPVPLTYDWSSGETTAAISKQVFSTQTFTVTVTDANGCTAQESGTATVGNNTIALTACCDTAVCPGTLVHVSASAGTSVTFVWNTGQSGPDISNTVTSNSVFTVTATDANGCSAQSSVTVNVSNAAPPLTVCCDTFVCDGGTVTMTASSTSQGTYVWSTGSTTTTTSLPLSSPLTFIVTFTDASGCVAIGSANGFINTPQTTITAVPDTSILLGQTVQLSASGDSVLYTYVWSPALGLSNSSIYNPVAKPEVTTTYCVTMTDNLSCTATDCYKIELVQPDIKIPDAFSPNEDLYNDFFTIFPLKQAEILETRIYNRWGEVVFTSKGNIFWDGYYKSMPQPAGAYVCQVTYGSSLNPGKANTITKGFILIR